MTYDWLQQRVDTEETVFGPLEELLLTRGQRRALIVLLLSDVHFGVNGIGTLNGKVSFLGYPVRVPRLDAHLGAVEA